MYIFFIHAFTRHRLFAEEVELICQNLQQTLRKASDNFITADENDEQLFQDGFKCVLRLHIAKKLRM